MIGRRDISPAEVTIDGMGRQERARIATLVNRGRYLARRIVDDNQKGAPADFKRHELSALAWILELRFGPEFANEWLGAEMAGLRWAEDDRA